MPNAMDESNYADCIYLEYNFNDNILFNYHRSIKHYKKAINSQERNLLGASFCLKRLIKKSTCSRLKMDTYMMGG